MAQHPKLVTARTRVAVAVLAGGALGAGLGFTAPWQVAVLGAWDLAAAVFLGWVWSTVGRLDGDQTRAVALREDSSRGAADLMLLVASVTCLVGVGLTLVKAAQASGPAEGGFVAVAVLSVVASWAVVHTVFTLRYARLHYGDDHGGVDFNDDADPTFLDFAYVAFTIGMTYQVSDTDLTSKAVRRTALRHGLLSYLFGTFIVAMTINVVAGLLK